MAFYLDGEIEGSLFSLDGHEFRYGPYDVISIRFVMPNEKRAGLGDQNFRRLYRTALHSDFSLARVPLPHGFLPHARLLAQV